MSSHDDEPQEDARGLAELSALADGTLDPARREEVESRVAASPDLRERLARERRAVAVLASARTRDRAPGHLRARIEATRRPAHQSRAPARIALAGALAAVAVVLALILPSGTPGGPSISQAAALGARGATMAAPAAEPSNPGRLRSAVGVLHFPNWGSTLGFKATGERQDRLDGRRVVTVYYAAAAHTVAYSIISGPVLRRPDGDYYIQSFRLGQRTVVTWRQAGHTCVLAAAGLSERVLAGLVAHA